MEIELDDEDIFLQSSDIVDYWAYLKTVQLWMNSLMHFIDLYSGE